MGNRLHAGESCGGSRHDSKQVYCKKMGDAIKWSNADSE